MNIKARAHWVEQHIPVLLSTIHTLISILTLQHNILTNFSINRMNFIAINLNYWGGGGRFKVTNGKRKSTECCCEGLIDPWY